MVTLRHTPDGWPIAPSQEEWDALDESERDAVAALLDEVERRNRTPDRTIFQGSSELAAWLEHHVERLVAEREAAEPLKLE